jgi:hypothetical protein
MIGLAPCGRWHRPIGLNNLTRQQPDRVSLAANSLRVNATWLYDTLAPITWCT